MRIMIVGDGKMGHSLAEQLVGEGHEVTIIEKSADVLRQNEDTLDALFIQGNGVSRSTLKEANAHLADLIIAATVSDESNMLCCYTAKLLGTRYAVARIRDPEYYDSQSFIQHNLSVDYIINPERAAAFEISRILRYPFAGSVETFARNRVEMMDYVATADDVATNVPLRDLYKRHRQLPQVLFSIVERDGKALIPKGDFVIHPGDRVHVASDAATITDFFRTLGKNTLPVRNVLIAGGSRIAHYLANTLLSMKMRVTIVEINPEKARAIAERLPAAEVLQGDGTSQEFLSSIGLTGFDAFVTLMDHDEDNLMTAFYAVTQGVAKVVAKNNRLSHTDIFKRMGLDSVISTKQATCNTILRLVRSLNNAGDTAVTRVYRLAEGGAEALEFVATEHAGYLHVPLKDLKMSDNALIATIVRGGRVRVPFGNDTIEAGDNVIIITKDLGIQDLNELIRKK